MILIYIGLPLFLIAGAWTWIEAWLFIITFTLNISINFYIINKKNPQVLRSRMKVKKEGITEQTRKAAGSDKIIFPLISIGFIGAFLLPALDYRFQWTRVPLFLTIFGLIVANIGLLIMYLTMLENPHASKLLDLEEDQKLIDTGSYAHVRHPLYSGAILMIIAIPLALGSWISFIPAAIGVISLIVRIKFEEELLIKGLEGYVDYRNCVKYKLIPKIY